MDLPKIPRDRLLARVQQSLGRNPVTALLGPRQCGKTTLARQLAAQQSGAWFDLEDPIDLRRLETPMLTLRELRGLVVLDEVQQLPELFKVLRVLADRPDTPARFLVLGSASPTVVRGASDTLAGRIEFIDMHGFMASEVEDRARLWTRGGFPRSYLAEDEQSSVAWRRNFLRTFLNVDLALVGPRSNPAMMGRFWTMLAHYHGQTLNASELARSLGVSDHTIRHYLDLLTNTFMIRQLLPWFENVGKRLVKAPKIYFRDSGLMHTLMGIDNLSDLQGHPKLGASWEGFAMEQTLDIFPGDAYFWGTHNGAEIDLFMQRRGKRWGFEFKYADAPGLTKSMMSGLHDLRLDFLWVVYPGDRRYALAERVTALPLQQLQAMQSE